MSKPPKIVNMIEVPLDSLGGGQRTTADLDSALRAAGYDVATVCPDRFRALHPHVLDVVAGPWYRWRLAGPLVKPHLAGADLLIANNAAAGGLDFAPLLRVWQNEHSDYADWAWPKWHPNYHRLKIVDTAIERSAARNALNFTVSERMAESLRENLGARVSGVIENAIDTDHFKPLGAEAGDGFRKRMGLPPRPKRLLLYVGRPVKYKGLWLLADWARRFSSEFDIVLAGTDRLPSLFKNAPNVHAIGRIGYEDLPALYASADIFASPSFHEGCSYSVMEAMSCGVPSLLTDAGHVRSIPARSKELGRWIATTGDPERLTEHLKVWLSKPEIPKALCEELRSYSLEFHSMDRFAKQWSAAVESVLRRTEAPTGAGPASGDA